MSKPSEQTEEQVPLPPDILNANLREAFSQTNQLYRQFVMMKYYTFAACIAITAGLTAFFFHKPPYLTPGAAQWIKYCGAFVAVLCAAYDIRIGMYFKTYLDLMSEYALSMRAYNFAKAHQGRLSDVGLIVLGLLSLGIYVMVAVAWLVYAELPS